MSEIDLAEMQTSVSGHHRGITTALCSSLSAFLPLPIEPKCTTLD
jgi:hypothetical protein